MKRFLVRLFSLGVVLAGALAAYSWYWLHETPLDLPQEGLHYELARGESLSHVAHDLGASGALRYPVLLRIYARLTEQTQVRAGEYQLVSGLTPVGLIEQLSEGNVILHSVTLIEGWTYQQALEALHAQEDIEATLKGLSRSEQLTRLSLNIDHPEGWFFPDTYRYVRGTTDVEILRRAHQAMRRALDAVWAERSDTLPIGTPYEALILASLIERETGAPWERREIAGVFVRRLQRGMRLQTDPTVIYGMGDRYQGRITRQDLRAPTAYNTYTIAGLPPTPIALPGREALAAAVDPAPGTSLYFVARGDGTHVFSDDLDAHNRAVREYQLQRREDYRSSPPSGTPSTR